VAPLDTANEVAAYRWGSWALAMESITFLFSCHPFDLFGVITGLIGMLSLMNVPSRCCGNKCAFIGASVGSIINFVLRAIGVLFYSVWMAEYIRTWINAMFIINLFIGMAVNLVVAFYTANAGCCQSQVQPEAPANTAFGTGAAPPHIPIAPAQLHIASPATGQLNVASPATGPVIMGQIVQATPTEQVQVNIWLTTHPHSTNGNTRDHAWLTMNDDEAALCMAKAPDRSHQACQQPQHCKRTNNPTTVAAPNSTFKR